MRIFNLKNFITISAIICLLSCQIAEAQVMDYRLKGAYDKYNAKTDTVSAGKSAVDPVKHRPKIGVVMSGGGAKGFAHIRALKAIEEAGIPIDYIAGTSMGSIIGGLYAVGYDPDMMENLTTHQDWGLIIMDKVPRRFYSLDDRFYKRNYWLRFPIINGKLKVKSSIVDGVYVNMLLTRLTLPAYKQRNFNDLSVPFFCVATDMTTADPVVWESGSMSNAIRSSMSIPLLFSPVDHGNKLLCDGGLLNNFPVRLMREKGADIVIGIDLESDYIDKDKLDNSLKILERLIAVVSQHESNKARESCDILIRPDIGKANMLSFNDFSPILKCGDEAGKAHETELKALADSLQKIEPFEIERPHVQPIDSIFIDEVAVEGVSTEDQEAIKGYFNRFKLPKLIAIDDIEEIIVDNYSTGYYADMWYEVKEVTGKNILVLHCKASSYKNFGITAHYDNNYRMQLLLNYSMMTVSKNSKRRTLGVDVNLADHPYLKAVYRKHQNNVFSLGAEVYAMLLKLNSYEVDKTIYGNWSIQENDLKLFLQYVPNRNQQLSLGAIASYSQIKNRSTITDESGTVDENISTPYEFYPSIYLRYFFNNEDDADFTRSGWNINVTAKCIFWNMDFSNPDMSKPYMSLMANVNKAFPIGQKHSIRVGAVGAMPLLRDYMPAFYTPIIGGQSRMKYRDEMISFTGVPFVSAAMDYVAFIKTSWYWNIFKGLYTQVNCDFGSLQYDKEDWFKKGSYAIGAGLAVGYKTPIGPIELQLSKCNMYNKPVLYINLGFWF